MTERVIWQIGSPDGRSDDLVDNFREPDRFTNVVWRAGGTRETQRWPLFHPSEADPEGGYRHHPYHVEFTLDGQQTGPLLLELRYLVIAPRLSSLRLQMNGVAGEISLRPTPSTSGEIRLHAGLHTSIYSEGVARAVVPAELLQTGINRLTLTAHDGGEVRVVEGIEHIRRLDRMANSAGFIYQSLCLREAAQDDVEIRCELLPSPVYRRREHGELRELCDLYLEWSQGTAGGHLTLHLDPGGDRRVTIPSTAFGETHIPFEIADGEGAVTWRLHGELDGRSLELHGEFTRRRKWTVFVTPHVHTDIGYTHRQWEVAERLSRVIDRVLDLLDAYPHPTVGDMPPSFGYHLDSSWALETYQETRDSASLRRLHDAIRDGRIGVASSYVDLLTHYAALEDLVRNAEFTDDLLRPDGLRSDFTTVVDVASITSSFPDILSGCGVRYLVHADNQDRGPLRVLGGMHRWSPFYWEGPAGGRILVWLAKMYCELRKVCGSPPVPDGARRGLHLWLDEYERADYVPDAVLLYGQEADNTDIDAQPVEFVQRWNREFAYPRLVSGTPSDFFRYVEERFGDSFRTVRGDEGAYWEDGAGADIRSSVAVRGAQASLPAAETLESLAVLRRPGWAFPRTQYDQAWRQMLLFDEHTWGAFLSGTDPDALLQRDQWAVKEEMARETTAWAGRLLHVAAVRHSLQWNTEGREIAVYNPHAWRCSGVVHVEIGLTEIVLDAITGKEIPVRTVRATATQREIDLWVDNLPGLSYRRYRLAESTVAPADTVDAVDGTIVLENEWYHLEIDTTIGAATHWIDRRLDRDLADAGSQWQFGQFLYARGGEGTRLLSNRNDLPDGDPEVLADFCRTGATHERHAWGETARLSGKVPGGMLEVTWTLPHNAPHVDVHYRYTKAPTVAKEAVYIAFPCGLPGARVLSDAHLGWVNWNEDSLPGACKEWLPLQSAMLLRGDGADVLICSPDIPLFCVGDVVRGRWPKEMDLTGGTVLSYVLNNYWHTNYPTQQGGEITFGYRLMSGASIDPATAFRAGREARRPLYAHRISLQEWRTPIAPYADPASGSLARIDGENVALSTLKAARHGEGYVIRLQEIAGSEGRATIAFPGLRVSRAWTVDLLEREEEEVAVSADGSLTLTVSPWGLRSARVLIETAPVTSDVLAAREPSMLEMPDCDNES